jgi:hypothetical protein
VARNAISPNAIKSAQELPITRGWGPPPRRLSRLSHPSTRRTFLNPHFIIHQRLSAIALILALAACGTRGPRGAEPPAPALVYTGANTLVLPPIAYGKTVEGAMLTVADDDCDVPGTITAAFKDSLDEPYQHLIPSDANAIPGVQTLKIEIVEILANGGGVFSGPKIVEIKGTLSRAGVDTASFKARRVSFPLFGPPRSTCNIVGRATEGLGSDVAKWLSKPVNGAVLGDR